MAQAGRSTLHGPALRCVLLTAARIGEVTAMRWRDVDMARAEWFKPSVKSTRGGPRSQTLPLPGAARDLRRTATILEATGAMPRVIERSLAREDPRRAAVERLAAALAAIGGSR